MDRKKFLSIVGMSAGAYVLIRCLNACKPSGAAYPAPPTNVNITLNLWESANSALNQKGGYIYTGGLIIACVNPGSTYIAVSEYCTHQGTAVVYRSSSNDFYCSNHGSAFASNGPVTKGPAGVSLKQYNTAIIASSSGNSVHVFS